MLPDINSTHNYSFPTNIRFGIGVSQGLGKYLKERGIGRPLVVTDPNVAKLDFFKTIVDRLKKEGLNVIVYDELSKNPVKSDVLKGKDAYQRSNCNAIIGIGGGVGMDVARAIALSINHQRDLFDYDDLIGGGRYVTEEIPHFVTIPTTSGTGSEVGRSAIIAEDDTKKKRILFHPKLMAQMVFANPALTFGLPASITAATGMDALTHNMEAFLAKGYHPMADGIALEGIRLISQSLVKAVNEPDESSRSGMMLASLMGAVAFQKGLGVVHSLAHPLSALLDMHHGLANAICLPYGMQFNLPGFEDRFQRMAIAMGLKHQEGAAVIDALFQLNEKAGLPNHLSAKGVQQSHLETLAHLGLADFCHPSNPKPVSLDDFRDLYAKAL